MQTVTGYRIADFGERGKGVSGIGNRESSEKRVSRRDAEDAGGRRGLTTKALKAKKGERKIDTNGVGGWLHSQCGVLFLADAKIDFALTDEQIAARLRNGTLHEIVEEASMEHKSEILGIIHQNQSANLEVGAITEKQMREWDELCLASEPASGGASARASSTRPAPRAAPVR